MADLRSDRLTQVLVLACLLLGAAALLPRVLARPGRVVVEQPGILVSVEGQVERPGVYQLEFGARVADLLEAAGGFLPAAARGLVALAAPVTDGQVVQVPALSSDTGSRRVSVNSAPADLLQSLPGVGPAIAQRIIENRPYSRIDDLLNVPGIGPRTLERLRPQVGL
ncbi:MAG: ComEA family DNA-binding protein [Trueperaceae bacterium]|jgi:competence protein ComEA